MLVLQTLVQISRIYKVCSLFKYFSPSKMSTLVRCHNSIRRPTLKYRILYSKLPFNVLPKSVYVIILPKTFHIPYLIFIGDSFVFIQSTVLTKWKIKLEIYVIVRFYLNLKKAHLPKLLTTSMWVEARCLWWITNKWRENKSTDSVGVLQFSVQSLQECC